MLRSTGCALPVEIWMWEHEYDPVQDLWVADQNAIIKRLPAPDIIPKQPSEVLRWQWLIKPMALLKSKFRHIIFLDADNFPIVDPTFLFDTIEYSGTGAIFWPDVGRMQKEHPIWNLMYVQYRDEPDFESGQMVIDTLRHKEPLEFALQMNWDSEFYYTILWGDKDTFRFAFHKFGRSFSMTQHPLQMLALPGSPQGSGGVMCQHDFEGTRIFQHRNMAKWDLLAENPRIPGYLYEEESREILKELRTLWNGRLNWSEPKSANYPLGRWSERRNLVQYLIERRWLLDDRRPAPSVCCGPAVKWSAGSVPKPWLLSDHGSLGPANLPVVTSEAVGQEILETEKVLPEHQSVSEFAPETNSPKVSAAKPDPAAAWSRGLRRREVAFAADSTLREGASPEAYWWDLELEAEDWVLYLVNEAGRVARMTRAADGGWMGRWLKKPGGVVGLKRVESVFPFLKVGRHPTEELRNPGRIQKKVHVANHAFGVGDAITGLYAAAAMTQKGRSVVYHTRFARWLQRASHPLVTITEATPPKGTRDMDADYAEQLRYAPDKVAWYAGQVGWEGGTLSPLNQGTMKTSGKNAFIGNHGAGKNRIVGRSSDNFVQPLTINREVSIPRLDFPKYVLLAPFAAWEARDWPETHWRRLAWLLKEAGYEIVAIGTKAEAERMERTFNKSFAYWAIDHDPEWVMDAMLDAEAVIGLDSGMIHVAGLLQVPAICIHAHLPPEFLFFHAPSVRSVTPATGCVFCRWQEDRGFMEGCATACSAMAVVGPEAVMAALKEISTAADLGRTDDRLQQEDEPGSAMARGAAEHGVMATKGGKGKR